jgi:predicted site-specific integrase-resolvase
LETQSDVTLSIGEAAKELGISTKTLRRWTDAGKIKFELIQVFSARLYGARSHKNKKLIDDIAKAVEDVK